MGRTADAGEETLARIEAAIDRAAGDGMFAPREVHPLPPESVSFICDAIFVLKFLGPNAAALSFLRGALETVARDILSKGEAPNART